MNIKGVSPVVSEVLLVLLTIAAVAIISTLIVNFIKPNLEKSTECVPYQDYLKFREEIGGIRYNCYDENSDKVGASINAKSGVEDSNIAGFKIVFVESDGSTTVKEINNNLEAGCGQDKISMFGSCSGNLKVPKSGDTYTYVYNSGKTFKTMEVYPILSNGRVCDRSDSINIINCFGVDFN